MKLKSTKQHTLSHGVTACACGLALLATAGAALADGPGVGVSGGTVTAISVTPNVVQINHPVSVKADVTGVGIGVDCNMRWDALEGNTITTGVDHKVHKDGANSTDYTFPLAFAKAGVYTLRAHGGAPDGQTTSCGGDVKTTLTVVVPKEDVVAAPVKDKWPTLTSIKRSSNERHPPNQTWIEVQGTGFCSFSIATAGSLPQNFASTSGKPFPVTVAFMGALPGAHQWMAKGTGTCQGQANAAF